MATIKPRRHETTEGFVARAMADPELGRQFPDPATRLAKAVRIWTGGRGGDRMTALVKVSERVDRRIADLVEDHNSLALDGERVTVALAKYVFSGAVAAYDPIRSKVDRDTFGIVAVRKFLASAPEIAKAKGGWSKQPRVPAGSSKGGQFTSGGAGGFAGKPKFGGGAGNYLNPKGGSPYKGEENDFFEMPPAGKAPPSWLASKKPGGGFKAPQYGLDKPPSGSQGGFTRPLPDKPTPTKAGDNRKAGNVAVYAPGVEAKGKIGAVPFKSWTPPKDVEGWAKVDGQRKIVEPEFKAPPGKRPGAGVIVREADGRVWLIEPTKHFGGYEHTFPKGGQEKGMNLQSSAIKEAYEESGLKVRITGFAGDVTRSTSHARYYYAERTGGTPTDAHWETQGVRLVPPARLNEYLTHPADKPLLDLLTVEKSLGMVATMARTMADEATLKGPPVTYAARWVENPEQLVWWCHVNGIRGVETDLHVTIACSREEVAVVNDVERISIYPEDVIGLRWLGDALVLKLSCNQLHDDWWRYKDAGATWDFDSYEPHITLSYVPQKVPQNIRPPQTINLGPIVEEDAKLPVMEAPDLSEAARAAHLLLLVEKKKKAKVDNQPRVPAGSPKGGQWTTWGSGHWGALAAQAGAAFTPAMTEGANPNNGALISANKIIGQYAAAANAGDLAYFQNLEAKGKAPKGSGVASGGNKYTKAKAANYAEAKSYAETVAAGKFGADNPASLKPGGESTVTAGLEAVKAVYAPGGPVQLGPMSVKLHSDLSAMQKAAEAGDIDGVKAFANVDPVHAYVVGAIMTANGMGDTPIASGDVPAAYLVSQLTNGPLAEAINAQMAAGNFKMAIKDEIADAVMSVFPKEGMIASKVAADAAVLESALKTGDLFAMQQHTFETGQGAMAAAWILNDNGFDKAWVHTAGAVEKQTAAAFISDNAAMAEKVMGSLPQDMTKLDPAMIGTNTPVESFGAIPAAGRVEMLTPLFSPPGSVGSDMQMLISDEIDTVNQALASGDFSMLEGQNFETLAGATAAGKVLQAAGMEQAKMAVNGIQHSAAEVVDQTKSVVFSEVKDVLAQADKMGLEPGKLAGQVQMAGPVADKFTMPDNMQGIDATLLNTELQAVNLALADNDVNSLVGIQFVTSAGAAAAASVLVQHGLGDKVIGIEGAQLDAFKVMDDVKSMAPYNAPVKAILDQAGAMTLKALFGDDFKGVDPDGPKNLTSGGLNMVALPPTASKGLKDSMEVDAAALNRAIKSNDLGKIEQHEFISTIGRYAAAKSMIKAGFDPDGYGLKMIDGGINSLAEIVSVGDKRAALANTGLNKAYSNVKTQIEASSSLHAETVAALGLKVPMASSGMGAAAKHIEGVSDLNQLEYTNPKLGGTATGGWYKDAAGTEYLAKRYPTGGDGQAHQEVIASKLYQLGGVETPSMQVVKDVDGKLGKAGADVVLSQRMNFEKFDENNPAHIAAARENFATAAWLADWDTVGTGFDNTVMINGKAVVVDPGGSLAYRAQGKLKGTDGTPGFGDTVGEIDSLRNPAINQWTAKVFGGMSDADIYQSMNKVTGLSDQSIRDMVDTVAPPGMKAIDKQKLKNTLVARKADMVKQQAALGAKLGYADPPAGKIITGSSGVYKPAEADFNIKKAGAFDGYYKGKIAEIETAIRAGDTASLAAFSAAFTNKGTTNTSKANHNVLAKYADDGLASLQAKAPKSAPVPKQDYSQLELPAKFSMTEKAIKKNGANWKKAGEIEQIGLDVKAGKLTPPEAVDLIAAMKFSGNTWGNKGAEYANAMVASLGGWAIGTGNTAAALKAGVKAGTITPQKAAKPTFDPARLPPALDFNNWKGQGKGLSSIQWINDQNTQIVKDVHQLAQTGDIKALENYKYEAFDKVSGKSLGMKPLSEHPSEHVAPFAMAMVANIKHQLNPPKDIETGPGTLHHAIDQQMPSQKVTDKALRVGYYVSLGHLTSSDLAKMQADADQLPKLSYKSKKLSTATYSTIAEKLYNKTPNASALRSYTSSDHFGHMNNSLWHGKPDSLSAKGIKAFKNGAGHDLAPGTVLSRKVTFSDALVQQIKPGVVLQEPAFGATSINPDKWGGNVQYRMHTGPGVKGHYIAPNSHHGHELEMILPPNHRMVVLKKSTKGDPGFYDHGFGHGVKYVVDVMILPTTNEAA